MFVQFMFHSLNPPNTACVQGDANPIKCDM